jgi:hypothetical protein
MFRDQLWPTAGSDCKIWYKIIKTLRNRPETVKELFFVLFVVYILRINLRMQNTCNFYCKNGEKNLIFTDIGTSGGGEK